MIFFNIISTPLLIILAFIYQIIGNLNFTIIVFALLMRILLYPIYLITHKNSIKFLNIYPDMDKIKRRYAGDSDALNEARYNLFKSNKYNPIFGLLPLLIQLFILMIVFNSINIMLDSINYSGNTNIIIIVLSGLSALFFCIIQNKISPGALSQSKISNNILTIVTIIISIYFSMVSSSFFGIYWIFSNIFSTFVVLILEKTNSPKKLAKEALEYIESNKKTKENIEKDREKKLELLKKEKIDSKRFLNANKKLVFYALSSGQYKYYSEIIEYILKNSNLEIHYLTNDINDNIFKIQNSKLIPYYSSQKKCISLMLKLDTEILVTTMQDLQIYHIKRSIVNPDIEYIHIVHGMASLHLTAREKAYDYFDTFFCVGPHHAEEIRKREEIAGLRPKNLVKAGYGLYDQLSRKFKNIENKNEKPQILIAPSWQDDNLLDNYIDDMLDSLLDSDYKIILRPHPQYIKIFPERINQLIEKYKNSKIIFDLDFLSNESIFLSDILITDWSGIAFEFSFATLKPSIFINTKMKVLNPNYKEYDLPIVDIELRNRLGVTIDTNKINLIKEYISNLLKEKGKYEIEINKAIDEYLYYPHRFGEAGGKYILNKLGE